MRLSDIIAASSPCVRHGILAPSMVVAATHAPARAAAVAANTESTALPRLQLSVAEYGLGVPSIVVYAAAEPKRLQTAGAALAVGPGPGRQVLLRRSVATGAAQGRESRQASGRSRRLLRAAHPRNPYPRIATRRKTDSAAPGPHRLRLRTPLRTRRWRLYDARVEFGGQDMADQCLASRKRC